MTNGHTLSTSPFTEEKRPLALRGLGGKNLVSHNQHRNVTRKGHDRICSQVHNFNLECYSLRHDQAFLADKPARVFAYVEESFSSLAIVCDEHVGHEYAHG